MACPASPLETSDIKEKQFKKIMELFGYANPYRMLGLCQQIADIQGETLTINVPFPEVFYYKM